LNNKELFVKWEILTFLKGIYSLFILFPSSLFFKKMNILSS